MSYHSATLWMHRFRINPSTSNASKLEIVSLRGNTESAASDQIQVILENSVKAQGVPYWLLAHNHSAQRNLPPPLTVEISTYRYVLDYTDGLVQWFKEPLDNTARTILNNSHWFYERKLDVATINEVNFLGWMQVHCCPMASIFRAPNFYHINFVLHVSRSARGLQRYRHATVWAAEDTMLQDLFQAISGAGVDDSFSCRKVVWVGSPPQLGVEGEVYTYLQSRRDGKTLQQLGWQPCVDLWLMPERLEVEVGQV